uniref:FH2 domain-containing protein n=1 Tax=Globodera pallida TaxID=36090 RepID=A0A183BLU0_GLOPA
MLYEVITLSSADHCGNVSSDSKSLSSSPSSVRLYALLATATKRRRSKRQFGFGGLSPPLIKRERRSELLDNVPGPSFSSAAPTVANIAATTGGLGAVIGETAKRQKAAEEKEKHSDALIQLKLVSFDKFMEKCAKFNEDFKQLEKNSEEVEKNLRRLVGGL